MTPKPDPPVLERHRRMAEEFYEESYDSLDAKRTTAQLAQLIATVERDAFARGVEAAICWCKTRGEVFRGELMREALLPEPQRGEECACTADLGYQPGGEYQNPACPVHGTKER